MNNEMDKLKELIKSSGNKWILDNMILIVRSGSRAYGTDTEDSDYDYKGICIPPLDYHLGTKNFKSLKMSTSNNEQKNGKDDIDITIYGLQEFVRLLISGNPNVLEMPYVEQEDILYASDEGIELGLNRDLFLSNHLANGFGGWAISSMKYLDKALGVELDVAEKKMKNSVRLYVMAEQLFKTGTMNTRSSDLNAIDMIGKLDFDVQDLIKLLKEFDEAFHRQKENSVLKEKLDVKEINKLTVKLNMSALGLIEKGDVFIG